MKVFLGFDSREKIAYDICKYSIEQNTFTKNEIIPLVHKQLRKEGWFSRPWNIDAYTGNWYDAVDGRPFSTEFSHTRFLVPALCNFNGWALFMDSDMVWNGDIKDLFKLCDDKYAVMCVKHNHKPTETVKMDGVPQSRYFRKNWSSFILFNCNHPANKKLTPEVVSTKSGAYLHAFEWLADHEIGELPDTYNWIEGVSRSNVKPQVVHYTEGGVWFEGYKDVVHGDLWWRYYTKWIEAGEYSPTKETVDVQYGYYK